MSRRDEARTARYALAGALSVTTSELLQQVHRVAGGPVEDVASLTESDRPVAVTVARARSAAAACSALVARLLIIDRDNARRELPEVGGPASVEPGVTTVELEPYMWQASLRVTDAARAEVAVAAELWQNRDDADGSAIEQNLLRLLGYVDAVRELLSP